MYTYYLKIRTEKILIPYSIDVSIFFQSIYEFYLQKRFNIATYLKYEYLPLSKEIQILLSNRFLIDLGKKQYI